jgi:hypothetical protein
MRLLRTPAVVVAVACCATLVGCVMYLQPTCTDQIRNGNETDVDCGGSCGPCAFDQRCAAAADCESEHCADGRCAPLPCQNGVQDGTETDVDCGGPTCHPCAGGRHCRVATDCANQRCDAASGTCTDLRPVTFAAGVSYPSGPKTYVMWSGDMNRDGLVDLVAANEQGNSVTVLLGRGDGTFAPAGPEFPTGAYPTGGAIADFNGDGIPDVVTANYHGNSVSILLGVGDGTLGPPGEYPTEPGAETSNLAVGDLNGDGVPDVVATNPATGSMSVFLGRADGTLQPGTNLRVGLLGFSSPFSAAIADFDGDGKRDVALADDAGRAMIVRLGNGDGTFRPEVEYPIGGEGSFVVVAADVNMDGKVDLVVANRGSDGVSVLLGRGDGTFRAPIVAGTGAGTGPYALAIGDFNLDGVPDVVTANYQSSTASVLLGVGDGRFEAPLDAGNTGNISYGVATGDFNRDGRPDFAVCNAASNDVVVRLNTSP